MYSRCAEWTAAALLYRHNTMTEDNTSSVASNCRWKTKTRYLLVTTSCSVSHRNIGEVQAVQSTYSKSESWSTVTHDGNSWKENRMKCTSTNKRIHCVSPLIFLDISTDIKTVLYMRLELLLQIFPSISSNLFLFIDIEMHFWFLLKRKWWILYTVLWEFKLHTAYITAC